MPQKDESARNRTVRIAAQRLESLRRAGVTHLRKAPGGTKPRACRTAKTAKVVDVEPQPIVQPVSPPDISALDRGAALRAIGERVAACTRCAELARTRTQTVFGVGNPHARLIFMGEAPGAEEDRQGEPFVGAAGQLLTKIIEACGLRRADVYILNTIKCRPPGNRTPTSIEAANCREYLDGQLDIIRPEFICCLGAVAAQNLLDTTTAIGKLRGRFHDYRGIRVLCTYHPAYLLRYPDAKRHAWEDMKLLMAEMGVQIPSQPARN